MSDLAEFLLARITEDEAAAHGYREHGRGEPYNFDVAMENDDDEATVYMRFQSGARRTLTETEFRAEFMEPAVIKPRSLAEAEAKRRIVEEHPLYNPPHAMDDAEWWGDDKPLDDRQQACARCGYPREFAAPWPCPTLRALASVYADHPDYLEEWHR